MIFNEYGACKDQDFETTDALIAQLAGDLFKKLVARGVPLVEIRSVAHLLEGSISVAASETILFTVMNMKRKAKFG